MAVVLKVSNCEDVRRLTIKGDFTFATVMKMITDEWPEVASAGRHIVKYVDDEGDLCTLAPATFDDFVMLFSEGALESSGGGQRRVAKLQIVGAVPPAAEAAAPAAWPARAAAEAPTSVEKPVMAVAAPPPGLGGQPEDEPDGLDQEAFVAATCQAVPGGGGPWKVLKVIHNLKVHGVLTRSMLASLTVQWLPMLTQRVTRKLEKINWFISNRGLSPTLRSFIDALAAHCAATPGFEPFAKQFSDASTCANCDSKFGECLCSFLKALHSKAFDVQVAFVEALHEQLVALVHEMDSAFNNEQVNDFSQTHEFVECDGCGMRPIRGPRFKCQSYPDYDLCGNCYARKDTIHPSASGKGESAANHTFQCILLPQSKGKGKGKEGKSACKGKEGKGPKGWKAWKGHGTEQTGMAGQYASCGSNANDGGYSNYTSGLADSVAASPAAAWINCVEGKAAWKTHWKGKAKAKGKGSHHPAPEDSLRVEAAEFKPAGLEDQDGKLKLLRDMGFSNEELNRELLSAHGDDHVKVIQILTDQT